MFTQAKVVEVISSLFILLFVYAAFSKWLDLSSFEVALSKSPLIGSFSLVIAWVLPALETGVAVLLFFPATRFAGLGASLLLMLVFSGYILYMLLYSVHLPCSCGGVIKELSWRAHLFFNLFWIVLAITGLIQQGRIRRSRE